MLIHPTKNKNKKRERERERKYNNKNILHIKKIKWRNQRINETEWRENSKIEV